MGAEPYGRFRLTNCQPKRAYRTRVSDGSLPTSSWHFDLRIEFIGIGMPGASRPRARNARAPGKGTICNAESMS
jgi:hypothetical protein